MLFLMLISKTTDNDVKVQADACTDNPMYSDKPKSGGTEARESEDVEETQAASKFVHYRQSTLGCSRSVGQQMPCAP